MSNFINGSRRYFLQTASAAAMAAMVTGKPQFLRAAPGDADEKEEKIVPTADCVVILWMAGGVGHTETFDPKRYTPYEKGLKSSAVLSTFPAIDTKVEGIKLCQGLERIASVM